MMQYLQVIPPIVRIVLLAAGLCLLFKIVFRLIRNRIVHKLPVGSQVELRDGTQAQILAHLPDRIVEVRQADGRRAHIKEWGITGLLETAPELPTLASKRKRRFGRSSHL